MSLCIVWITCPTNGRRYPTGLETDDENLEAIPVWTTKYTCLSCGKIHRWAEVKAELVPEPAPIIQ